MENQNRDMTPIEELRQLYRYNSWANARIFEAASKVPPEDFTRTLSSSFPSLRETLVHIVSAEWIWLERWRGTSPSGFPEEWNTGSFASLKDLWQRVDVDVAAFVSSLTAPDLEETVAYRNTAGRDYKNRLGDLLRHVVNHATYHRGQVTTILRTLGAKTVSTDLLFFFREQSEKR